MGQIKYCKLHIVTAIKFSTLITMMEEESLQEETVSNEKKKTKKNMKSKPKKSKKQVKADETREKSEKSSLIQTLDITAVNTFEDLPLSTRTQEGLQCVGFTRPTDIQKEGIVLALQGRDVLGAAKTGSGKTLAFLVPVLEVLWHESWSNTDGMGAMIISPTRELALQTYEVLRKVGKKHDFSAALIIGGKDLNEERQRIANTNILIGTPGRILQHFDETPDFHCYDLKLLILDEADRCLDLGFAHTLNAIIAALPTERQTLLYSATQTKSVKDLARLSLKKPNYIDVHEAAKYSTPKKLIQNYIYVELQDKINFLYSFIRNHLKSKCIVFVSSCKQVQFLHEVFRKLRPGIPLNALYGKQKQLKRVAIYNRFCGIQHAVLFATDIAARGLDFSAVNWVVQFDCPESVDTYIHRVGRTARFEKGGQALMMILPSEKEMITKLTTRKVPIHELKSNPKKMKSIEGKLQSFCVQEQLIKEWAQKSIVSYVRSVFLQADKSVFDVTKLPLDKFSTSCGLVTTPKLQFMKKKQKQRGPLDAEITEESIAQSLKNAEKDFPKMLSDEKSVMCGDDSDDDDDDTDEILVAKSSDFHHENIEAEKPNELNRRGKKTTKTKLAKAVINKNITVGTKIVFADNDDKEDDNDDKTDIPDNMEQDEDESGGIDISKAKQYMQLQDTIDYEKEKQRVKLKHKQMKERGKRDRDDMESSAGVQLHTADEESDDNDTDEDKDSGSEDGSPHKKRRKESDDTDYSKIAEDIAVPNTDRTDDILSKYTSTVQEDEGLALHLLGVG